MELQESGANLNKIGHCIKDNEREAYTMLFKLLAIREDSLEMY